MRSRLFVSSLFVLSTLAAAAHAQDSGDRYADGLQPGDYLRIGVGMISPVHPQGSLRDWGRGQNYALAYENWASAGSGVSRVAYSLSAEYSRLPLNERQFLADFSPANAIAATSASASSATTFMIGTGLRLRFPAPFIMPSIQVAFSYLDYRPATIHYTSTTGGGTASQQHRRGAAFTVGGGLEKTVISRLGIFGEALYTYGFTGLGQGLATPGGACTANGCDVLKNTTVGVIRGGLRIQMSR